MARPGGPGVGPRLCHGMLRPHTEASPRAPQLSPCPDPLAAAPGSCAWLLCPSLLQTAPLEEGLQGCHCVSPRSRGGFSTLKLWITCLKDKHPQSHQRGHCHTAGSRQLWVWARDAQILPRPGWTLGLAGTWPPQPLQGDSTEQPGPSVCPYRQWGCGDCLVLGPSFLAPLLRALP